MLFPEAIQEICISYSVNLLNCATESAFEHISEYKEAEIHKLEDLLGYMLDMCCQYRNVVFDSCLLLGQCIKLS